MIEKVAFLGLGRMGSAMATNLAKGPFAVTLYNRSRATAVELAARLSARVAETPREAAEAADVVITMLADAAAMKDVYYGSQGVLAGLSPGAIAIDMGTSGPELIAELGPDVAAAGATLVDAPVSGSTPVAQAGQLTILAGGEESAVKSAQPIFDTIGRVTYHVGALGAGSAMKLAVNSVVYSLGQGVAEALVLAERSGISRPQAYAVFRDSAISAPLLAYREKNFIDPETSPATFQTVLGLKDLVLIKSLAAATGSPMPQAETNSQVMLAAIAAGHGAEDIAAVAVYIRELAQELRVN
jgi:3-hydroxyisobutyrate dehydrogenase-like beta-hydroxyacid dehydrogenase